MVSTDQRDARRGRLPDSLAALTVDRAVPPVVLGVLAAAASLAVLVAAALPDSSVVRAGLAVVLAAALAVMCWYSLAQGLFAVTAWLAVLGLARRLVSMFQADPSSDPLLLVAPAALAVLLVVAFARGAFRDLGWFAWGVVAMSALTLVQVLNPTQGSLRAGVVGLLFWLVPMLWFWVGRVSPTALLWRLLAFITGLTVLAALAGLYQAVIGLPAWDQRWYDERGYRALEVNGPETLRQWGFSSSAGEYALLLSIGLLLAALFVARALYRRPRRWNAAVPPALALAVLAPALALASVRTAVALTAVAFAVVFVAQRRWGLLRATAIAVGAGATLVFGLSRIDTDRLEDQGVQGMVRRTVRGLGDPFGTDSTLRTHWENVREGMRAGIEKPFGEGTSAATLAGSRFEGGRPGTENDLSDAAIAFGVLGIMAVAYLTVAGFVSAFRAVRRVPGLVSLATLGVLVLSIRFWWNGAHYAPSALLWLLLGWADVASRPRRTGADADEATDSHTGVPATTGAEPTR